jgi:hypothetical protein
MEREEASGGFVCETQHIFHPKNIRDVLLFKIACDIPV